MHDTSQIPVPSTPKDRLKKLAESDGVSLRDLLVLAPQNDPFNCGGPEQIKQAEWFSGHWHRLMGEERGHLRKFHYKCISQQVPLIKPDGTRYSNTEPDWERLQTWSKFARYLGLVDPLKIVDQRNPEPHVFAHDATLATDGSWHIEEWLGFDLPEIRTHLWTSLQLPGAVVEGYTYREGEQPYLIEVWTEKSTMDEELIPVYRRLGANLVSSTGFQSVTGSIATFNRVASYAALGRPVRILYLSDFDPAGDSMPVAVSRQIEFWHNRYGDGFDIKLTPLALTKAQVGEYDLPTIPIRASDKRRDAFTERYGVDGAVELDALEAIHPGELARILAEAIEPYRDEQVELDLIDAGAEAEETVSEEWDEHVSDLQSAAEELHDRVDTLVKKYEPKLKKLADKFNAEMEAIRSEAESLEAEIRERVENTDLTIALPIRPVAEVQAPDESNWLYASDRSFGQQLRHYRSHREGA